MDCKIEAVPIFITGAAGFIGYHLALRLLSKGYAVHGIFCGAFSTGRNGFSGYGFIIISHGKDFRAGGRAESAADTAVINMIFHK